MAASYDRETYWSSVGGRMAARPTRRDLAGDDDAYNAYKKRKMTARFLATLPVADRIVLELGCGPGGNLAYLAQKHPTKLIGVDISHTMLALARERLGDTVSLLKTDGLTIPVPDQSVDLAYTVTVLQHNVEAAHMHAMVAELARVSRGPVVLIEDLAAETSRGASWIIRRREEYQAAASAAGLRLLSEEPLRTAISRKGLWRIRRLFVVPAEGERQSLLLRGLGAAWIAVARHFDDRVSDHDLTKMVFVR